MEHQKQWREVAIQAALEAGKLLRKGFGTSLQIINKPGHHNLVTQYDYASEAHIFSFLMKKFPSHGFFGEERGQSKEGDVLWIVDPLDGTVNFAHNIPVFCVSIAAFFQGEVRIGCIYQPMTEELFWAEKGEGAFLNGMPLKVTSTPCLEEAFLTTGFPYNLEEDPLHCIETFSRLTKRGIPIRRLGSAAIDLSYVAAGRFDGYWEVSLQPWDFAAGKLLVEEAGGVVTRYDGAPLNLLEANPLLAAGPSLHLSMQRALVL